MIRQLFPILVYPKALVPLLTVTHSLMVVLSPMITCDSSPSNFKSCGIAAMTVPGKILQFLPILAPFIMVTLEPIHVPSPISTSAAMVVNGSTVTFCPIFALGSTAVS